MPRINSSAIKWASYHQRTLELTLTMTDGTKTTYKGVPSSVYKEFLESDSQGRYFNLYIRNQYEVVE